MIEEIKKACEDAGEPLSNVRDDSPSEKNDSDGKKIEGCEATTCLPAGTGEVMAVIYNSLSDDYRRTVETLEKLTGNKYTSINIVGGGCQDKYLNALTAEATGLEVFAGPVEGTAIGNLIVQMIAGGEFADLAAARAAIA
jgi:rhamnulokinase